MTKQEREAAQKFVDKVDKLPRTIEAINSLDVGPLVLWLQDQSPEFAQMCWAAVGRLIGDIADLNPNSTPAAERGEKIQ